MNVSSGNTTGSKVDFAYSFGTPHRLTVCRPDGPDKTLLDAKAGELRMAWSYHRMADYEAATFVAPPTTWELWIKTEIDGQAVPSSTWRRLEGDLPVLENCYGDSRGRIRLTVAGGETAAVTRIEVTNTGDRLHRFVVNCDSSYTWANGVNLAWLGEMEFVDSIISGWKDRSDRVLVVGLGAQEYVAHKAGIGMVWTLAAGQSAVGWLVRPYKAYKADLPALRQGDWAGQLEAAIREWRERLDRAVPMHIPDPRVGEAVRASLADLFVMREPTLTGQIAGMAGTEVYRAANNAEPAVMAICLDQFGYPGEAEDGYEFCLEQQGANGDWADPEGWSAYWWSSSGFKSWAVIEHYKLTGDRAYLERQYPRLLASSRFLHAQRQRTRKLADGRRPLTYGLMPKGAGDCGLFDDDDFYGVFYPHNFWATYADQVAAEVAAILDRPERKELESNYQQALDDLLMSLADGAIEEDGYRWIPAAPGKTSGSRWGALNALFPCRLLPADHELITGTIRKIESRMSPGGIPMHTGWLEDGMWVAITLDNLGQAQLVRGEGDKVAEYFYAVLNHGTPLYTWCEERGPAPGTETCTGDRQHLFTPVAVLRAVRDMMVMEEDQGLHVGRGVPRSWLASGREVGVERAPTHFGPVSWTMRFDAAASVVKVSLDVRPGSGSAWIRVHVRLPGGRRVAPSGKGTVAQDGQSVLIKSPASRMEFELAVGE